MERSTLKLSEIRRRYVERPRPLPAALEMVLRGDPRPSARAILAAVERRRHENRSEGQRLRTILRYEGELWAAGVTRVAGLDEAGMSPLAGPVAAAAVVFPPGTRIPYVDDCKRLDARERERLAPIIREKALAWAVAFVEPEDIDRLNIYWAGIAAMTRALAGPALQPRAPADRCPPAARRLDAPAGHRARRPEEPVHRRRLHPGQDRARRPHARAGRRLSGLRVRQAQGVSGQGPLRGPAQAGRLSHPPPLLRPRARGAGAGHRSRCRPANRLRARDLRRDRAS